MAIHSLTVAPDSGKWAFEGGSFDVTTEIHAGISGSGEYRAVLRIPRTLFAPIGLGILQKLTLQMRRTDTYSSKTHKFGFSTGSDWASTLISSVNKSISSGVGTKTLDLTSIMGAIKSVTSGTYIYLHVRHGSGDNSYASYASPTNGTSSYRPKLILEYADATVEVMLGGVWTDCVANVYKNGQWVQCIPFCRKDGVWKQIGG